MLFTQYFFVSKQEYAKIVWYSVTQMFTLPNLPISADVPALKIADY